MCWSTTWRRETDILNSPEKVILIWQPRVTEPISLQHWNMWLILQRMTLAAHLVIMVSCCQGGTKCSQVAYPRKCCTEHTMTSLCKREGHNHTGRQGTASTAMPHCSTEEAGNVSVRTQKMLKEKQDKDATELGSCWKQCWLSRGLRDQGVLPCPASLQEVQRTAMVFWPHYWSSVCTEHWVSALLRFKG